MAKLIPLELTPEELAFIEKRRAKAKTKRVSKFNQLRNALSSLATFVENDDTFQELTEVVEAKRVLLLTTPKRRYVKKIAVLPKPESAQVLADPQVVSMETI